MFFNNPIIWWLAPLIAVPLLIHFRRFFRQQTQALPSLFFVKKLASQKRRHRTRHYLLETILEMLMIFLILFIWSQPTWQSTPQTGERLIILIDDSPSMRYFYVQNDKSKTETTNRSALIAYVETLLQDSTFSQIEARRLSTLGKDEGQVIHSIHDLQRFLYHTGESSSYTTWQDQNVKSAIEQLANVAENKQIHYLLYSDFKGNHFTVDQNNDPLTLPETSVFYILPERTAPYLHEVNLPSRHFFKQEKVTLTHTIDGLHDLNKDLNNGEAFFIEVTLDDQKVFLSKLEEVSQVSKASSSEALSIRSDLVFATEGTHILTVALKEGTTILQRHSEIVFVYPKMSLRPFSSDPAIQRYLEALFLYDKRAETISLSSSGEILIITDPQAALTTLGEEAIRQRKAIILLSPQADIRQMERILRDLGAANIHLSSLEKTSAQSKFYWNERPGNTPSFDPTFSVDQSYLKVSPSSLANIRSLFMLDNHPVMFHVPGKVFLTLLSEESLIKSPHPLHLVWFYEALFALNGGREQLPVYDEVGFSLSQLHTELRDVSPRVEQVSRGDGTDSITTSLSSDQALLEDRYQYPRVWEDDTHLYILKTLPDEYSSASIIPAETKGSTVLPHFGSVTILETFLQTAESSQGTHPIILIASPVNTGLLLAVLCLLALLSSLIRRFTIHVQQKQV